MRNKNSKPINSKSLKGLKRSLFSALCLAASTLVQAEDLLQTYEIAYCNDPTLEVAKQTQRSAREALPQAVAQFLPVINATGNHTLYHVPQSSFSPPPGTTFVNQYGATLTQPIYHFEHWARHAQASESVLAANYTYAAAEQDLMIRTSERYFAVLRALDNLRFLKAQRQAFERFVYQTEQRYKVGLIAITDVQIARARRDNALSQEIAAENTVYDEKEKLREITCKKIDQLSALKEDLPIAAPEGDTEQWVAKTLAQNLELKAACYTANAAKANIKIQRAGHLPSVDLVAQYNKVTPQNNPITTQVNDNSIGLQVTLPIFNGGGTSSRVRQSMYDYLKSDGEYERTHRQAKSNARQYYQGVLTQVEKVTALKQAVVSNQSALKATEESFNVGTRTIVDVLNAQSDLIQAENDLVNAKYDYILETLRLKQTAGMLCPLDLERINTWLKKSNADPSDPCPT